MQKYYHKKSCRVRKNFKNVNSESFTSNTYAILLYEREKFRHLNYNFTNETNFVHNSLTKNIMNINLKFYLLIPLGFSLKFE